MVAVGVTSLSPGWINSFSPLVYLSAGDAYKPIIKIILLINCYGNEFLCFLIFLHQTWNYDSPPCVILIDDDLTIRDTGPNADANAIIESAKNTVYIIK